MRHSLRQPLLCLAALALAAGVISAWIIPGRLALGAGGSRYTVGVVGDVYTYAQRIQPLIAGTTSTNPVNGICDPNAISEYYLEDACRLFLTLTGLDTLSFIWVWHALFPLVLAALLVWLSAVCVQRRRPWLGPLRVSAAAAAFVFLYAGYDLVTIYPPLQGWLQRVPTNIEYPLSVLTAVLYLGFLAAPSAGRGIALALAGAALIYLRPYLAMPWGLALGSGLAWLTLRRAVTFRVAVAILAALLLALAPWLAIRHWNTGNAVHLQMLKRYFTPVPYAVHIMWPLYVGLALALAASARAIASRFRPFVLSCAASLLAMPVLCGSFVFAHELLAYDRFGAFYLAALAAAGMLVLREPLRHWRGRDGLRRAQRCTVVLALAACLAGCSVAWRDLRYDLMKYPLSQYPSVVEDLAYLPAYTWISTNTAPEALCIVDDGLDWSENPRLNERGQAIITLGGPAPDDLFQLVARRRRVYTERLYGNALPDLDVLSLAYLQRGTFGLPVKPRDYAALLRRYKPTHILWRKRHAPIPRGYGSGLQAPQLSTVVYEDDVCAVWELRYPAVMELEAQGR